MFFSVECDGSHEARDCCTETNKCQLGGGDCGRDAACVGDLVCGQDNCLLFHDNVENRKDCCTGIKVVDNY